MLRQSDGTFKELRWEEALTEARKAFESVDGSEVAALIGPHADAESMVALRDLMHRVGTEKIHATSTSAKVGVNLRSDYLMNSRINGVDYADFILLVGTNLRSESPLLNTRIMRSIEDRGIEVCVLGTPANLNLDYEHIGVSPNTLSEIARGEHPVSRKLAEAELPMIIVSDNALAREDGEAIMNNLKQIAEGTPVHNKAENWNGLNVLHTKASSVGALDIGIPMHEGQAKDAKLVYLLGHDDFRPEDIPEDAFVIY